jgi:signal transduction histidine kinase
VATGEILVCLVQMWPQQRQQQPVTAIETRAGAAEEQQPAVASNRSRQRQSRRRVDPDQTVVVGIQRAVRTRLRRSPDPRERPQHQPRRVPDPDRAVLAIRRARVRRRLTNTARHAKASSSHIRVDACPDAVSVEVADDGVGLDESQRRSGLANLRARAERHRGSLTINSPHSSGVVLYWTVPLSS